MDALTLLAAVEDARPALREGIVRGVFSAGMAGLWLDLVTGRGAESLLISAEEVFPRIARGVPRPPRARSLAPLAGAARRVLPGTRLAALAHRGLERVLRFEFASPFPTQGDTGGRWHLIAELFGSRPNLILIDASTGNILEAVRHDPPGSTRSFEPGLPYSAPPAASRADPRLCRGIETLQAALAPALAVVDGAAAALRLAFVGLTDRWAREVTACAGGTSPEVLAQALADLLFRVEAGPWEPHLLLDERGHPTGLSPIRLRHLPQDRQQPAGSLGDASERLAAHQAAQRELTERQRALRQVIQRLENRLRSRRVKLVEESSEFARADEYRRMGEALVAHQPEIPRGATEARLPDLTQGEEGTITIPLDPAVPLAVNVERLFKAARRGRRGAVRVTARLAVTDVELGRAQDWGRRVAEATLPEQLDTVQRELDGIPRLLAPHDRAILAAVESPGKPVSRAGAGRTAGASAPTTKQRRGTGPVPRRFVSSEGFPILVGRDNQGNDHLTLHLSRSEDLWLHTEGFPGSHVVIRVQNRTGGIPRRTLIEAAQLAAYYSQARTHGKVAVSYTLRKYVRKPRKSPPGQVTITQVKTIVVKPDKSLVTKLAAPESDPE
jgi:predicted ribosome quality control (RQC) complex YloA/Tae2 family protein